ncbi:transposase, partial [Methanospirillum sp.]|uniref:IS66 family transposase n=1 Tax=Methanospirillum sp. TaxID=45200 RepID=UPI00260D4475
MVYISIYQLLSYDRLCETFSDLFGRSMSKATLARAVSECYQNLAGVEEKIRELLADAQVLPVDETGMRVNGIRQWLHVVSNEILTVYGHHRKRGSQAMDDLQILPQFRGTMVHDFWAPYFRYKSRHALCNAHLLRELKGITENYPQKWSEQMHDLIQEIKGTV